LLGGDPALLATGNAQLVTFERVVFTMRREKSQIDPDGTSESRSLDDSIARRRDLLLELGGGGIILLVEITWGRLTLPDAPGSNSRDHTIAHPAIRIESSGGPWASGSPREDP
jgi:hypothetical protein